MSYILILYDIHEKDLVRDFNDLFEELNFGPIKLIALSPDMGLTLEGKEGQYLKSAEGVIFIITPGAERFGSFFPSPSVSHEMGQVKQKFEKKPENVIYLVDKKCNLPAIDQKGYIQFDRNNMRSILESLIQLFKNLKQAGLFRTSPIPTEMKNKVKQVDIKDLHKKLSNRLLAVAFDISNIPGGIIWDSELDKLLHTTYSMNVQDINFLKRDLEANNLVSHQVKTDGRLTSNFWILSGIGWEVARLEVAERKKTGNESLGALLSKILENKKNEGKNTD
ncbi:MAG: hypothetical protein KKH94_05215 [Candidatus Omnitrophica bacterium]|nr:hypothetical protein [Candidatus Omnitrophota bacterium]